MYLTYEWRILQKAPSKFCNKLINVKLLAVVRAYLEQKKRLRRRLSTRDFSFINSLINSSFINMYLTYEWQILQIAVISLKPSASA